MHIVLANQWYPPESGWGGVAMWNYTMAHAYRSLGHDVTMVTSRHSATIPGVHEVAGIRVHRLFVRDAHRWRRLPLVGRYVRPIQQLAYSRRVAHKIRELHRERRVDVVEFAEVNAEGLFHARAPIAPFVVRCHTPTFVLKRYYDAREMPFDTRITGCCEKELIRRANALTAPSRDMAQVVSQDCGIPCDRIDVIPNAFSWAPFLPPDGPAGPGKVSTRSHDGPITVLHVGRLERVKGVVVLAQAIPHITSSIPDAHFVFVGADMATSRGTSQRSELEALLAANGVGNRVEFVGRVEQPALVEWYRRADICVVPSLNYESFSYTCAQAMAAGKPVVASRIGGIPETLGNGITGILVTPGNVNELAKAIIQLALDEQLCQRMGRAGRERVEREFDPIKVAHQNLKVYERVASRMAS